MSLLSRFYKSLFVSRRWYQLAVGVIVLFVLSYGIPMLYTVAQLLLLFLVVVTLLDYVVLFATRHPVEVEREMADRFSNGDDNAVRLQVRNRYPFPVRLRIIDEVPEQFQLRNFVLQDRAESRCGGGVGISSQTGAAGGICFSCDQCLYQESVPADRPAKDHTRRRR